MWVYVCVYAHTHTHCTDELLACEPRGWDDTPGGPEDLDGINLGIYIVVCVYKVHVYVYARRRDEILD